MILLCAITWILAVGLGGCEVSPSWQNYDGSVYYPCIDYHFCNKTIAESRKKDYQPLSRNTSTVDQDFGNGSIIIYMFLYL